MRKKRAVCSDRIENTLMEELRHGKLESLELLFEKYYLRLYNYFLRMTNNRELSEDLVQEVFLRLLKYRTSFKRKNCFSAWLFKIARHAFLDQVRKKEGNPPSPFNAQQIMSNKTESSPHQQMEKADEESLLSQALSMLSPKKREVLVLSRFQHFNCREIADILGLKPTTVKVRIHRAIKELRQIYFQLSKGDL